MTNSTIRFSCFPRTNPPPEFVDPLLAVFQSHEAVIGTAAGSAGMTSNQVLAELRDDLVALGFDVEGGPGNTHRIERPVFFGESGEPTLRYQIDAYHPQWECGLEVEAGRAWMGNAVYRDLVQASVMVQVKYLVLAVPNAYRYTSGGRATVSQDYRNSVALADALYGHTRLRLPYDLVLIGY